jgi:general secretion pathway protein K
MRRDEGFALVVVLWVLVLVALVGTEIIAAGRTESRLAANLRAAAQAEAAADGATYEALFRITDGSSGSWAADDLPHLITVGGAIVQVRIENDAGKLNPNLASVPLLEALMLNLGVPAAQAQRVATAILDWRSPGNQPHPGGAKAPQYVAAGLAYAPPNAPLQSLDELGAVLGMSRPVLDRLRPYLSLYVMGDPNLRLAAPPVAAALREVGDTTEDLLAGGYRDPASIVSITATAMAGGARFTRRATVRINPAYRGRPYRILTWDAPAA